MHELKPCPQCQRHIRLSEQACPFCQHALPASFSSSARRPRPEARVGRAATFVLGLSLSSAAVGCKDDADKNEESQQDAGGRDAGGREDASLSDASLSDAGESPLDSGSEPDDASVDYDFDGSVAIYAAAPTEDDGSLLAKAPPEGGTQKS